MPDFPDTLAKFCSARTAEQILGSRRLRWSAPHLLSDPFELTHHSPLTFDPLTLLDGVIRAATGMIFSREMPKSNSALATVIRRWREEERFASPEEAEDVLKELMSRMVDQRQVSIEEMMADWRKFTRELRICCFSAKADNLTSWQLFADHHRGAALRFRCGEYTSLPDPKPVEYSPNRPEITTFRDQINAILHQEKVNAQSRFLDKFLVKPPMSADQQEWRCFFQATDQASSREVDDSLWYDDRPFEKNDLDSVYLGAFMPAEDKQRLVTLLRGEYPETKVLQASPIPGKYEIEFHRLKGG
ncbi:hypothetical protein [Marinimicrobium agarilyticum]|uniref:hypothetical protein n=1 Tax=Marinimicrobium agarilyticum TaxID=306546 RepID=UPI00041653F8|nr:hypothetical protein [Marinimicrobium agarilyticum]